MGPLAGKRRKRRRRRRRHPAAVKPTPTPVAKPPVTPPPAPAEYPIAVPSAYELLVLNRFGQGYTPGAYADLRAAGGAAAWFEKQLRPASVPEAPKVARIDSWFAHLWRTPAEKWADNLNKVREGWRVGHDFGNWSILRRIYSNRSLQETMVGFWSDVLHIPNGHPNAWVNRFDYDAMIRRNALGRFDVLLREASLHPSMRAYLDNWTSKAGKPNENQGRELLELHSVTRAAGYTEDMVKSSAILLSGYTLDTKTFEPVYDPARHTTGSVSVLGFSSANTQQDGQQVTLAYLDYLAHHPQTARTVARRLATAFVSDSPPASLVDRLADVFTSSGTDISATLRALVASPEFASSHGAKVRTPISDLVATTRALGVDVQDPQTDKGWVNAANWLHGSIPLYGWPRPDGAPLDNESWCSASRMFRSYEMHLNLAGGYWPREATYVAPASRLPVASLPFEQYVDHLCRTLLGRGSSPRLLDVACQVTGLAPGATVTATSAVAGWLFARLGMALLDTPEHMST